MISRAADGDEIDSREYKRHGHYFHRCEAVESEAHADNRCHNWLDIVVHSDKCRAQILLSYHSAYIGYEGGEYDYIAYSGKFDSRDITPGSANPFSDRHGGDGYRGESKHPFHQREHRVFLYEISVEGEIQRIA